MKTLLLAAAATMVSGAAHAAIYTLDFEDQTLGVHYTDSGLGGTNRIRGTVVGDASNHYLILDVITPTYGLPYSQFFVGAGNTIPGPGSTRTGYIGILRSFDVYVPKGVDMYNYMQVDIPRDSWQHVTLSPGLRWGTDIGFLGGTAFLDNIEIDTVIANNFVPEPGTWALMIAGFGMVGTALRRRTGVIA